jgi:rubrerythrin
MKGMNTMAASEAKAAEIKILQNLMYGEAREAKYYADLARSRCAYSCSSSLKELSEEETAHLKRLQAEYYISTGSTFFPCVAMLDIPRNYLEALRERFLDENESAKAYLDAAEQTANPRLSTLYAEFSADELRHAENMASLISDYICSI